MSIIVHAGLGRMATRFHTRISGDPDDLQEYHLSDLLADLRHFADEEGWAWESALERADLHYREERADESVTTS